MEENSELEEGEAHYCKNVDDNIDPETDLSYIDEKVQNFLGHHLKDFEGGVSAENLGAKFGGYGSFLSTYERSPSVKSCPKPPRRDASAADSLYNLSTKGPSQNLKPTSNAPPSLKLGTSSCSDHLLQNSGVPSAGVSTSGVVSVSQDLHVSSVGVAEKFTLKDARLNKLGHPTDQRPLRLRIKMRSNKVTQKNTAIYSGLGLDNSPSSSWESAEESGRTNALTQGSADESPTSILQDITSFPVPGDVLISPLHGNFLCLMRKERLSRDCEPMSSLKDGQEHSSLLLGEPGSSMGSGKLLEEKKAKLVEKSDRLVELKHGVDMKYGSGANFLVNKNIEIETPGGMKVCSIDSRCAPPSNSLCIFDSVKVTGGVSKVSREADKNRERDILVSSNLPTEELLEPISGKESGNSQKGNGKNNSTEKVQEQRRMNSHNDVLAQLGENEGKYNCNKASVPLKAHSDDSKRKEDTVASSEQKAGKKSQVHVGDATNECNGRTEPFSESKKLKGNQMKEKVAAVSKKETSMDGAGVVRKDPMSASRDASTCKSKIFKLKSRQDVNGARDTRRLSLDSSCEQHNSLERPSNDKFKFPSAHKFGVKLRHNALIDKSKEKFGGKKAVAQAISETFIKDDPHLDPCTTERGHPTEMVEEATVPHDNWVCCDSCQKWRLLPYGTTEKDLPKRWLCSMQNWLPGLNRCDTSEDETTKAFYALYQLPIPEGQNNVQNYGNGTASVITSIRGIHLDQNHNSLNSSAVSNRGKKKHGLEEKPKAGGNRGLIQMSKSTKTYLQDSMKSRSLIDMNDPPAESNVIKKSSSYYINKSDNLDGEKHTTKQKEKCMNGAAGDAKKLKMKNNRDADQHENGTFKKARIGDINVADKHMNSDVGFKPSANSQTKASGKNMPKYKISYSENTNCDSKDRVLLSIKKLRDQPQVSSDLVKKRKWPENQNRHEMQEYANEKSSQSGFGRAKKSRSQMTDERDSSASKGADNKSIKNCRVTPVLSGSKVYPVDGTKDVRSVDKDQQLQKLGKKVASQQTLDDVDSRRRDFGCGEVLVAATSSSSKVSGSCRNGATFKEVKGSPVESVSSSPFRGSYIEKLTLGADIASRKSDHGTDYLPVNGNPEKCWHGEGNGDKVKVSDRSCEHGDLYSKKSRNYDSEVDFDHHPLCSQIMSEGKKSSADGANSIIYQDENHFISKQDSGGLLSSDGRTEKQLRPKDHDDSIGQLCASINKEVSSQKNVMQDIEDVEKAKRLEIESVSCCVSKDGQKTRNDQSVLRSKQGTVFGERLIDDSCEVDVLKASRFCGSVGNKNGACPSLGCHTPDLHEVKNLDPSSPRSRNLPSHNATKSLKEAKELRDYADRLKNSGFEFESNEAYFQAALKFLHGASLLETHSGNDGRHGEMTQIQVYSTTAKLCELCAHEYERRQEMGAAALAYKCMEVAYMRVVYCKHSSTSRDRNELQATLNMAPQGESPSSSASDVDNLNNQATDKALLSNGTLFNVTGNHVIVARNRPQFVRLLDLTQDVNFAMEASRKSQDAFASANVTMGEAQNKERVANIKRVIDFSFQDVETLIHLVRLAMEAINR